MAAGDHREATPNVGAAEILRHGDLEVGDTMYSVRSDDDAMAVAVAKARRTLHYFLASLRDPAEGMSYFSVKARFPVDDGAQGEGEHIWLGEAESDGDGNVFGVVGNEPQATKRVRFGQRVGVREDDITDWMIVDHGRLTGGYTIHAIRNGMTQRQRAQFDQSMGGMIIDAGDDRFPADGSSPEGVVLAYEAALDANDLAAAADLMDFDGLAHDLLAERGDDAEPVSPARVAEMAGVLRNGFLEHFASVEAPTYAGVRRAFPEVYFNEDGTRSLVREVLTFADGEVSQRHVLSSTPDGWRVHTYDAGSESAADS